MTGHDESYVDAASAIIDATLRDFYPLPARLGAIQGVETRREYAEDGVYVVAEFALSAVPDKSFRCRRKILSKAGPDKDPELAAITYTVSLMERLVTRQIPEADGTGSVVEV